MTIKKKSRGSQEKDVIVGLDVGTTKICVIVARVKDDNNIDILGIGKAPSFGLHRGIVVNPNKTTESIKEAIEEAELNSGVSIKSVSVGIAGHYIRCIQSSSIIGINNSDRIIQEEDIVRLIDQAKILKLPSDTTIIDVIPQEYIIDGKDGIFETPVGMFGVKLEARVNIITGLVSSIDDLSKCVTSCGVDIDDIVLEPIASSYSVLDETEKKVGVAMIDIGGGTSDIAVFKKGVLKYTAGIGIAGNLVTNDIVEALGISEEEAERIKREYGYSLVSEILNDEEITVQSIRDIPRKTSKSILARIIQARMQDIFELSAIEIQNSQIAKELHAGVVITGGGSLTKGTKELAEKILGMEVNLGIPTGLTGGLIKEVENPIFATGVGLVLHRLKSMNDVNKIKINGKRKVKHLTLKGIFEKVKTWFDEL
ncbi:MAG: cell division protein FtsA [Ignavibacteria bacterium]|nr:cell division protein FtsA [Ignavibacteria bacterium]MBK7254715.1 cell division protein FtsA [Ignavibacteria bacterium]MBK7446334.1 cell division protein FtsA [Ignavibacteria bacterium]MBK8381569.1 cell division protein FtsA [Ignavibacteria bacterium]MBK9405185.1 cell division protein FtsA [Ignavibacteria bacterium]